jgi:hypothetical protein
MSETREELEQALSRLEQDWLKERERWMVRMKDGKLVEPGIAHNPVRGVIGMVICVIIMALIAASPLPPYALFVPLIPFARFLFMLLAASGKGEALERTETAYLSERASVLRKLEALRNQ